MRPSPSPSHDLEALFQEHRRGLSGAVRGVLGPRADVHEVLQDAFLVAWKAQRAGRGPTEPVGWIFVLTINLARGLRRKTLRRSVPLDIDEVDELSLKAKGGRPDSVAQGNEAFDAAEAAIRALPAPQKEVFLLRVSGGLAFHQVAAALGIPEGTAKTRMRAALAELRQRLQGYAPVGTAVPTEGGTR